jgi:DNA-binding beta-propeller fold protein YncE
MTAATVDRPAELTTAPHKRRRWVFIVVVALLGAGAAAAVAARPVEPILVTDGAGSISLIDPKTGEASYTVTDAIRAPDGSTIYRAEESGGTTVVEMLDPKSGEVLATTQVGGKLEIRAVSPLGDVIALMAPRPASTDLYVPEPREYTAINVVWSEGREPRNYTLKGNFEPETFSTDGTTLFMLEFYPPTDPDRYFVRQLDLESGGVTEVITPDQGAGIELNPEMRGHARAQVMAPDGSFLFSLYTIESDETPVHDPADPHTDRWAFVHTLNLREKWSHCIFLPVPFGTGAESAMSLAISGDGKHLFVLDAATQNVARIDARKLRVDTTEEIPGLYSTVARPIAVGPEIVYIGLGDSVLEMGRETLIPNAAFVVSASGSGSLPIKGLELAADGRTLRVAHESYISVLDMPSERIIATLKSPGRTGSDFVGDPVGMRSELSLDWVIPGS